MFRFDQSVQSGQRQSVWQKSRDYFRRRVQQICQVGHFFFRFFPYFLSVNCCPKPPPPLPHLFIRFKGSLGQAENWNECLKMAFRFCLIDRWFEFEFDAAKKPSSSSSLSSSIVGKQMSIPSMEKSNFVSIYEFLMSTRHFLENLNFSSISATDLTELDSNDDQHNSSTTLINETIAPTQNSQIDEDDEDSILLNSLKSFSL